MMVRAPGVAALAATLVGGLVAAALGAPGDDACRATTRAALRACQAGVDADRALASGRCTNLAALAARKACNQQAASDAQDAHGGCQEQRDARTKACARLGKGPYAPAIDPATFTTTIDNPWFPLVPGTTFVYEGQTAAGLEHDEFAVTRTTRVIDGVTCVEVHDTVTTGGELTEDTLDWFAQDAAGNVWYFGESSQELAGGLVVSVEGSWMAGVDGAQPGIVMEAHPAVGDFSRQEFLLGDAEDLAEVVSLDEHVTVGTVAYDHVLKTLETSPLEPSAAENKYYASGVGNVLTVDLETGERSELVRIDVR